MLPQNRPWDKNLQFFLIFTLAFNLIPQLRSMPIWLIGFSSVCIFWKILYLNYGFQLPKRWMVTVGGLLGTAAVYINYATLAGREASGALLVVMGVLKLLETNRYRDAMFTLFTCYFLLMSDLLDSQSLATAVFMVTDMFVLTVLMLQVHRRESGSPLNSRFSAWTRTYRPALRLLAITVPLWIFLFLVFPRFSMSLSNSQIQQSKTGFSDDLDPGSIDSLVDNNETAFRVRFTHNEAFSPESLYWRGTVLSKGYGLHWSKDRDYRQPDVHEPIASNVGLIQYDVWIEPGLSRWLFGLETPMRISSADSSFVAKVKRQPGFIFQTSSPLNSIAVYQMVSINTPPYQDIPKQELERFLETPRGLDPKIVDLGKEIKEKFTDSKSHKSIDRERLAHAAMTWFSDHGFRYSKAPGQLAGKDSVEKLSDFFFHHRIGFCEHFAAAFATLMRSMNVPARVVIGFQGGEPNEFGDYLLVQKRDAHAWAEIWAPSPRPLHPDRGQWIRTDPTALIAPLRLQLGGDFYKIDPNVLASGQSDVEIHQRLNEGFAGVIRMGRAVWDNLQMQWNGFLFSYDLSYQLQLLAQLGITHGAPFVLTALLVVGALFFAWILIWFMRKKAGRTDRTLQSWRRFCLLIEKHGVRRSPHEGPLNFCERAGVQLPKARAQIQNITELYVNLRYGPGNGSGNGPSNSPSDGLSVSPSVASVGAQRSLDRKLESAIRELSRQLKLEQF